MGWALQIEQFLGESLLHSSWVERLGGISFLGALDDHPLSRAADSRLDHSLAVTQLGVGISRALGLPETAQRHIGAACLLHDIGHFPMSHAAEAGFQAVLGVDHHQISEWIILGNGPISKKRSLAPILRACELEPDAVWAIIRGSQHSSAGVAASLFGSVINLDTLDGIPRSAHSFGWLTDEPPANPFILLDGILAISPSTQSAIDAFWGLKARVYDEIINRPSNVILEFEISRRIEHEIDSHIIDTFETFCDTTFRRRIGFGHPRRDILLELDKDLVLSSEQSTSGYKIERSVKRYQIDWLVAGSPNGLLFPDWPRRYRHYREKRFLARRDGSGPVASPNPTSIGFEK
jgi:hypothetical protein